MAGKDKTEMYRAVTDRLVAMMREGVAPWSKPWIVRGVNDPFAPHNGATGRYYRGSNVWHLALVAHLNGWDDPRWMTYRQAQDLGGNVRKGEKGTSIVFWGQGKEKDKVTKEETGKTYWYLVERKVWNIAQIDGVTLDPIQPADPNPVGFDEHDDAQSIADHWLTEERIPLGHGGDRAYYRPSTDSIQMPCREDFTSPEHYYQTLFHEIVHSSGHEKRQDRIDSTTFGSDAYAKEELVAEIGAAMLYATAGLERDLMEHSAAYLKSWADRLDDDPSILFNAISAAQRAAEYIMERVPAEANVPV